MAPVRKIMAPQPVSFFRSLKKAFVTAPNPHLLIPEAVYSKHSNGVLKGTVILEALGGEWQVEIVSGAFKTGWKDFCKDNELKENDMLVFKHQGGRRFCVDVFSSDGSPKELSAKTGSRKRSRGKADLEDHETAADTGLSRASDALTEMVKQLAPQFDKDSDIRLVISKVSKTEETQSEAEESEAEPEIEPEPVTPVKKNATKTPSPPPVKIIKTSPRKKESAQKTPAVTSNKKPAATRSTTGEPARKRARNSAVSPVAAAAAAAAGNSITPKAATPESKKKASAAKGSSGKKQSATKPASESKKNAVQKSSAKKQGSSTKKTKSGKELVLAEAAGPALMKAREFKSSNPCAVMLLKKSNVHPCFYLNVPGEFAKNHMPSDNQEFAMVDSTDKAWSVKWLGPPKRAFSGGWCYFAQDHALNMGDACVLEKLDPKRVKIHIFRGDGKIVSPVRSPKRAAATPNAITAMTTVAIREVVSITQAGEGEDGSPVQRGPDLDKVVAAITYEEQAGDANEQDEQDEQDEHGEDGKAEEEKNEGEGEGEAEEEDEEDDEDYDPRKDDGNETEANGN